MKDPYERAELAASMRDQGLTYREIGEQMGISRGYAVTLANKGYRTRRVGKKDDLEGLHGVNRATLRHAGYRHPDEVRSAIKDGSLYPGCTPWYGPITHASVCAWLGIADATPKPPRFKPETIARYIKALESCGYTVTKKGAKK